MPPVFSAYPPFPRFDKKRALAVDLYRQKNQTVVEIREIMGITKPTLYAYMRQEERQAG